MLSLNKYTHNTGFGINSPVYGFLYCLISIVACKFLKFAMSRNTFNDKRYVGPSSLPISPLNLVYNSAPENASSKSSLLIKFATRLRISLKSTTLSFPVIPGSLLPNNEISNSILRLSESLVRSLYTS